MFAESICHEFVIICTTSSTTHRSRSRCWVSGTQAAQANHHFDGPRNTRWSRRRLGWLRRGSSLTLAGQWLMRGTTIRIKEVQPGDAAAWESMRQLLWPSAAGEHAGEIAAYFQGNRRNPAEVFIACDEAGGAIGFVELSIRNYAEGCHSGRVAYIEGWYVSPDARRRGVGAALIAHAEAWGKSQECSELGSDCELDNLDSAAAHRALGFDEVVRTISFRKALAPSESNTESVSDREDK